MKFSVVRQYLAYYGLFCLYSVMKTTQTSDFIEEFREKRPKRVAYFKCLNKKSRVINAGLAWHMYGKTTITEA